MKHACISPISDHTWRRLVSASTTAAAVGWASSGVFATAIGPAFTPGSSDTLLYVGKSGGPLIDDVGVAQDQEVSREATTKWMLGKYNPSAFWVFADLLVPHRELLAWSNLAKIDTKESGPPQGYRWTQIEEPCVAALGEEMESLKPRRVVFATSKYQRDAILRVLQDLGFTRHEVRPELDDTEFFTDADGRLAAITRHPQGWRREARDPVAQYIRDWV